MKQPICRIVAFLVTAIPLTLAGCGGPELTDQELGHVHNGIPKLDGDQDLIPFPRAVPALAADLDPATQPAVQPSGATLPAVQPTGTTLPASQGTATLPTAQGT